MDRPHDCMFFTSVVGLKYVLWHCVSHLWPLNPLLIKTIPSVPEYSTKERKTQMISNMKRVTAAPEPVDVDPCWVYPADCREGDSGQEKMVRDENK